MIIGGGAAGLSAALVPSRTACRQRLLAAGREEVQGYGGAITTGTVSNLVRCSQEEFHVLLAGGESIGPTAAGTTGLRDELPDLPGLADLWARDVLHCPYCHDWEVRDQQLAVLWYGPETVRYAQIDRQWAHDVVPIRPSRHPDVGTALPARSPCHQRRRRRRQRVACR